MKNIWKKYQELWLIASLLLLVAVIYYFGVRVVIDKISLQSENIQGLLAEQNDQQQRLDGLEKLKEQNALIQSQSAVINPLIKRADIKEVIEKIEKLAVDGGTSQAIAFIEKARDTKKIVDKSKEEQKAAADKRKLTGVMADLPNQGYVEMEIRVSGSYADVFNFLRKLENINYYSDVIAIQLNQKEEDVAKKTSDDLFVSTLRRPDAEAAGRVEKSAVGDKKMVTSGVFRLIVYVTE